MLLMVYFDRNKRDGSFMVDTTKKHRRGEDRPSLYSLLVRSASIYPPLLPLAGGSKSWEKPLPSYTASAGCREHLVVTMSYGSGWTFLGLAQQGSSYVDMPPLGYQSGTAVPYISFFVHIFIAFPTSKVPANVTSSICGRKAKP